MTSASHYKTITVPVTEAFDHGFLNPILKKIIDIERGESSVLRFERLLVEMFSVMFNMHRIMCNDTDLTNRLV